MCYFKCFFSPEIVATLLTTKLIHSHLERKMYMLLLNKIISGSLT